MVPLPPSPLIGRVCEVTAATQLVLRDGVRLLTLTGPGGTGKTRMALEIASMLSDDFPDGVYFVDLAVIEQHQSVPSAIARVLGLLEDTDLTPFDQVRTRLGALRVLLVLDNFEHLVQAGSEIAELLADCSQVHILATSRIPLNIRAERELVIPPLAPDAAVTLFADRATAAQPAFMLTPENTQFVDEICRRLDGLPLAIELAAARIRALTPRELCALLSQHGYALLSAGPRDLPGRQQTLRNAIAWSYELLDSREQLLFRRLAIFRGGCTVAAAATALGVQSEVIDVIDGVQSLVAKNLLVRAPNDAPEARFTMLQTIREFALEQLDARGERSLAHDNCAKFCRTLAETAEPELLGSGSHAWIVRVGNELENFDAVVRQASCSGRPEPVAEALRLIGRLWWFCRQGGHLREAREWTELLLPLYPQRDAVRGWALLTAYFGWELHDASTARARATEALAIAREIGDERLAGLSLVVRALVSEPADSVRLLGEAVSTFRQIGDEWGLARALLHIALLPEPTDARRSLSEAGAIFERIGHNEGIGSVHRHFGNLAFREGNLDEAERSYQEALSYWKAADYWTYVPAVTLSLGDVALRSRRPHDARVHYEEALRLATELGSRRHIEQASARLAGLPEEIHIPPSVVQQAPGGLTERQLEVARLVAAGSTNREIAQKLVISERTAEHHVENILSRLGLQSRIQLAKWAADQGASEAN